MPNLLQGDFARQVASQVGVGSSTSGAADHRFGTSLTLEDAGADELGVYLETQLRTTLGAAVKFARLARRPNKLRKLDVLDALKMTSGEGSTNLSAVGALRGSSQAHLAAQVLAASMQSGKAPLQPAPQRRPEKLEELIARQAPIAPEPGGAQPTWEPRLKLGWLAVNGKVVDNSHHAEGDAANDRSLSWPQGYSSGGSSSSSTTLPLSTAAVGVSGAPLILPVPPSLFSKAQKNLLKEIHESFFEAIRIATATKNDKNDDSNHDEDRDEEAKHLSQRGEEQDGVDAADQDGAEGEERRFFFDDLAERSSVKSLHNDCTARLLQLLEKTCHRSMLDLRLFLVKSFCDQGTRWRSSTADEELMVILRALRLLTIDPKSGVGTYLHQVLSTLFTMCLSPTGSQLIRKQAAKLVAELCQRHCDSIPEIYDQSLLLLEEALTTAANLGVILGAVEILKLLSTSPIADKVLQKVFRSAFFENRLAALVRDACGKASASGWCPDNSSCDPGERSAKRRRLMVETTALQGEMGQVHNALMGMAYRIADRDPRLSVSLLRRIAECFGADASAWVARLPEVRREAAGLRLALS